MGNPQSSNPRRRYKYLHDCRQKLEEVGIQSRLALIRGYTHYNGRYKGQRNREVKL